MARPKDKTEQKLWIEFKEHNNQQAKEELMLRFMPLVKYVANRVAINLPDKFEFEDLQNYGIIGLIDAIERFDHRRGMKFSTYAISRIRGSIIDQLRRLDWVPTTIRRKAKQVAEINSELANKLGRLPTDEEIRQELDLDSDEYSQLMSEINIPQETSLDSFINSRQADGVTLIEVIADEDAARPEQTFRYEEIKRILGEAIEKLKPQERKVVTLYYYEGLNLTEIGEVLEVTTARISQLHTKAIYRLRGYLSRKKEELLE
ncbi:RNA polymerase, sigma 28 subunit, FliA/WhiG subfamily [Acetohalobium arabaticum DSM 5501]|uniref:RNA polymerase, sigma 28 subunit, FliA/WhiG subfamily n=1 Tax=Acetohalobium arabaticum (strain ATCC 49924 / DSM 5501 / Z-7288) TaxID=574087 RepID=D9QRI2_ACEAZ|nr:FliA/WhiG family RNA polymerase sigma factor [Acetohalobium arabaticum]ADL13123.1 RNA polymerase, sigma 28 subunit, FliA/WhiG subfamily [Acetohalobium arabaticum DSM 5501]